MLTKSELNLAGWASITAAIIAVPQFLFGIMLEALWDRTPILIILETLFMLLSVALLVFIYQKLRKLLNQHADFYDADIYLLLIIWINVVVVVLSTISAIVVSLEDIVGIVFIASLVVIGIILVVLGIKLLKCKNNFEGKLKYFAYLNIASGVMIASVILIFFGLLTAIIADIVLALIFFSEIDRDRSEPV